jgi:hypothetical protein
LSISWGVTIKLFSYKKLVKMCIKYGIIFFLNYGGPYLKHIFARCFTKNPFLALREWKMVFLCE